MLQGYDISNWQGNTPMDGDFLIIKASEGDGYKDPRLDQHYNNWAQTGKPYGFYHYARPDLGNSAEAECDWFLSLVGAHVGHAVFALDFEGASLSVANAAAWAKEWIDHFVEKTGVRPLLYIQGSPMGSGAYDAIFNDNIGCWAASDPSWYAGHAIVVIQQSVYGGLDHDDFYGDADVWEKYSAVNGDVPAPDPTPAPQPSDPASCNGFAVGDTVVPTSNVDYNGTPVTAYNDNYTIAEINGDRAVLAVGGTVWAAMNTANIQKVGGSAPAASPSRTVIYAGDTVRPTRMTDYNGTAVASYHDSYVVSELSGDRAVLTYNGVVWAAMHVSDLERV